MLKKSTVIRFLLLINIYQVTFPAPDESNESSLWCPTALSTIISVGTFFGLKKISENVFGQKPLISNLMALSGAVAAYYLCQTAYTKPVLTFDKQDYSKPNVLDTCLSNPSKALEYSAQTQQKLGLKPDLIRLDKPLDKEQVAKAEQQWPIFLLDECQKDSCILSRNKNPQFRGKYEERVSEALGKKIKESPYARLNYTSFASGNMFQDFVILTKALAKNPRAHIIINLIDTKYAFYELYKDRVNKHRIVQKGDINFDTYNQVEDFQKNMILYLHVAANQFTRTLENMFPEATLTLALHASCASYINYLEDKKYTYPDVLVSADIITAKEDSGADSDYIKLITATLKKNQGCNNLWLDKGLYQTSITAQLISYSLEKSEDAEKLVDKSDNKEICIFRKIENLGNSAS